MLPPDLVLARKCAPPSSVMNSRPLKHGSAEQLASGTATASPRAPRFRVIMVRSDALVARERENPHALARCCVDRVGHRRPDPALHLRADDVRVDRHPQSTAQTTRSILGRPLASGLTSAICAM